MVVGQAAGEDGTHCCASHQLARQTPRAGVGLGLGWASKAWSHIRGTFSLGPLCGHAEVCSGERQLDASRVGPLAHPPWLQPGTATPLRAPIRQVRDRGSVVTLWQPPEKQRVGVDEGGGGHWGTASAGEVFISEHETWQSSWGVTSPTTKGRADLISWQNFVDSWKNLVLGLGRSGTYSSVKLNANKDTPKSLQACLAECGEQFCKFPPKDLEGVLQTTLKIKEECVCLVRALEAQMQQPTKAAVSVDYCFLCAQGRDLSTANTTFPTHSETNCSVQPRGPSPTSAQPGHSPLWGNAGSRIRYLPCPCVCPCVTTALHHKAYGMWLGKNSMPGGEHSKASAFLCCSLIWLFIFLSCIAIMIACHMPFLFGFGRESFQERFFAGIPGEKIAIISNTLSLFTRSRMIL